MAEPLDQTASRQFPILSEELRQNIAAPCWACGTAGNIKATASRGGETRYFCHQEDRSCYNEWRGRYFAD